jgi:hypothetical protein
MAKPKKYRTWSRRIECNILACYTRANKYDIAEGLDWYQRAHEECRILAARYQLTLEQAAGVVAAISPGKNWGLNILDAETLIDAYQHGARGRKLPNVSSYGWRNVFKSERILAGHSPLDILPITGPKVRAFYLCMLNPCESSEVCIDRHAQALALAYTGAELRAVHAGAQYEYFALHYRRLAERLGLLPHQLQAICWVTWRRLSGVLAQQDIPF